MLNTTQITVWFIVMLLFIPVSNGVDSQTYNPVIELEWNADGTRLAAVLHEGVINIIEAGTLQVVMRLEGDDIGASIAWHPMVANQLAIGTRNRGIRIVNVDTSEILHSFESEANTYSVTFSPDGLQLLTGHGTPGDNPEAAGWIRIIDIITGTETVTFEQVRHRIASAGWSPDGRYIAGLNIGELSELVIWDTDTGAIVTRISERLEVEDEAGTLIAGHISRFMWSPDATMIVGATELLVTFWRGDSFERVLISDYLFGIADFDWSPDGSYLAVAIDHERVIQFVDVATGHITGSLSTNNNVRTVAWSPTGTQIAYAGDGGDTIVIEDISAVDIGQTDSH